MLLLKAAMPMLAGAAAQAQGKALVEVCTTYGVSLVPLDGQGDQTPASEHTIAHAGDHCALSALAALAAPGSPELAVAGAPLREALGRRAHSSSPAHDACATWVARLKHGPPAFA